MATKATNPLINDALAAVKAALDGGTFFLFSGPPPASPDLALDMVNTHTQAVAIKNGASGITFAAPVDGVLGKTASENWSGVVATDGKDGALTSITPTFFRICPAGDTGRTASSTLKRIQGTVGGPNSGADLQLDSAVLTEGATQPIGAYSISLL